MKLGEIETLMHTAATQGRSIVLVDQDGKTYRGTARRFSPWYDEPSGYAALYFLEETAGETCFRSDQILYLEIS